jgi:hypothetical protein
MTSGARHYGNSVSMATLNWDQFAHTLWMDGMEKMPFIRQGGSHRDFPFDSADFAFSLKSDPLVNIPIFRFNDRVPGVLHALQHR